MGAWLGLGMIVFIIIIIIGTSASERKVQNEKCEEERARAKEERQTLEEQYNGKHISSFVHIPEGAEMCWDDLPREIGAESRWGEKYTFYVTDGGNCYHNKDCHYIKYSKKINAYTAKRNYHPCGFCKPVLPPVDWVAEYLKIKEFANKNNLSVDFSPKPSWYPAYVTHANPDLVSNLFLGHLDPAQVKCALEESFVIDTNEDEFEKPSVYTNAKVYSTIEKTTYTTNLWKCSCQNGAIYRDICKHMVALAIKKGALEIDKTKLP